jgi:hypothetical protein
MNDLLDVGIMVVFFVLAIAFVRVLGRMIDRDDAPGLDPGTPGSGRDAGPDTNGRAGGTE